MAEFSKRFTLYAKSQGLTPEAVLARDEDLWPGGKLAGFIIWNNGILERYVDTLPAPHGIVTRRDLRILADPDVVDAWIEGTVLS